MHNCIIVSDVNILMKNTVQQMHVSVWWPKVQKNAHPLSVWIITALASGTPVFAKGLLWQRLSFFSPNTVALAAAEADIVFIHSTQHWGEESIETVVTVDASQRIRAMFSLERNRWNSNNRRRRSQCRTQSNCCDHSMLFSIKCEG